MFKKLVAFALILSAAFMSAAQHAAPSKLEPKASIVSGDLLVDLTVDVDAAERDMYVPTTGNDVDLWLPSRVEAKTPKGWRLIHFRPGIGMVLGIELPSEWKPQLITAGHTGTFHYKFSRRYFDVTSGQKLRVVVVAYPDELSLRNDINRIEIVTKPFDCP